VTTASPIPAGEPIGFPAAGSEPGYEVIAVKFGERATRRSQVFLNWFRYGEEDAPIGMDYFVWVVRNANRTVLVDAGFTPEVGQRRGRTTTRPLPEGLAAVGVDPASVETVIVSHGHYDHTGYVEFFPRARVVVSAAEFEFWCDPVSRRGHLGHGIEWPDIDVLRRLHEQGRVTLTRGVSDIAPGLRVVEVGGHTPGQTVTLVGNGDGGVVLATDALHYYEELEEDRPFVTVTDLPQMYRSFDLLRSLSSMPGAALVPGHDPEVMRRFPPMAGEAGSFAVRIT